MGLWLELEGVRDVLSVIHMLHGEPLDRCFPFSPFILPVIKAFLLPRFIQWGVDFRAVLGIY